MTTPATPTATSIFGALLQTIKSEFLADVKVPLKNAATALENNPTEAEVIAQGIAIQGAFIGQLPVGETQAIKAGASAISQLVDLIPDA